jgi:hypothetical protein
MVVCTILSLPSGQEAASAALTGVKDLRIFNRKQKNNFPHRRQAGAIRLPGPVQQS